MLAESGINWSQWLANMSIALTMVIAIYRLSSWRVEHVGKRNIDLAEEVLALFYEAETAIDAIRSPIALSGEWAAREPEPDEQAEDKDALDVAYATIQRVNSRNEMFSRLHALRFRFMVANGKESGRPFEQVNQVRAKLVTAASSYVRAHRAARISRNPDSANRLRDSAVRDLWGVSVDENDPIQNTMKEAVKEIETTCRNIIQGG